MKLRTRVKANNTGVIRQKVHEAGQRACVEVCEDALAEINGEGLVPYEEGTLERSGEVVSVPSESAAAVTYDTPYAARQHEDRSLRHPRQGRHHWLEDTIEGNADRYFDHIAQTIRDATGR